MKEIDREDMYLTKEKFYKVIESLKKGNVPEPYYCIQDPVPLQKDEFGIWH